MNKFNLLKLKKEMFIDCNYKNHYMVSVIDDIDKYKEYYIKKYIYNNNIFFEWSDYEISVKDLFLQIDEYKLQISSNFNKIFLKVFWKDKVFWIDKNYLEYF